MDVVPLSTLSPTKRALLAIQDLKSKLLEAERTSKVPQRDDIAIVGLGCRFPKADNPDVFWNLLRNEIDAITEIPSTRWAKDAFHDLNPDAKGKIYSPYGGFVDGVDEFDPQFFNISPREARSLDPQQRLLLEVSWEALEHANQVPERLFKANAGVFVGIGTSDYALRTVKTLQTDLDAYFGTGNALSVAAGRISYLLGLTGPAIAVDTACSSSLVAVHLACKSLQQGECNLALAGGVNLILAPENSISLSKARMLSPDGRCKTFDEQANGYVRGEGCGVVVLKRLKDAIADGDNVLAVIRGSAVNQDGPSGGLTVPNGPAQQAVIHQALVDSGVEPHQVQYVEAHGTGTALGDPIEVQALAAVYGKNRPQNAPLRVGTVKTNIGHLEAAAGIAGLIKLVLCLKHQEIPANLHFQTPSSKIPWADLPITIATQRTPWPSGERPRIAGLSSFGFSGTNAHLIVQEAIVDPISSPEAKPHCPAQVLTLSTRSQPALKTLVSRYAEFLDENPDLAIQDICFTANTYRSRFKHRLSFTAASQEDLQAQLKNWKDEATPSNTTPAKIAFVFTGQGSQYSGMGQQLYQTQPLFRVILDRCAEILKPWLDVPLLELLYPSLYPSNLPQNCLDATRYTQPALFAVEYALAQLWLSWGIRPEGLMGHSLGEYVAACIAGVFSLEDGLALIAQRSQLMDKLPRNGAMAAVLADEKTVREAISPYATQVSIAAFNGPTNIVISGEKTAIAAVVAALEQQQIKVHSLAVSHAFHSALMEPMLAEFAQVTQAITYNPPQIPIISNYTGQPIGAEIATADYWVQHLRHPVQFAQSTAQLLAQYNTVVEIGPKSVLLGMIGRIAPTLSPVPSWAGLPSLRGELDDWSVLMSSLGKLFVQGIDANWSAVYAPFRPQRITGLPTYPFQRQRYWFAEEARSVSIEPMPTSVQVSPPTSTTMPFDPSLSVGQMAGTEDRRSHILAFLQQEVGASLVGEGMQVDPDATFLELGADSINLAQTIEILDKTFGVKVTMRQIFEELTTLNDLASYLDAALPDHWVMPGAEPPSLAPSVTSSEVTASADPLMAPMQQLQQLTSSMGNTSVERILQEQLAVLHSIMSQQIDLMRQQPITAAPQTFAHEASQSAAANSNNVSSAQGQHEHPNAQQRPAGVNLTATPSSTQRRKPLTIQPQPDRKDNLPLSVAQKQMWWVERWAHDHNVYLIPAAVQVQGSINLAALEQSLNAVIARHESLRTSFHVLEGQPIQQVHPHRTLQLEVKPMNGLPELSDIQRCVTQLCKPLFNLETDLLLRTQVLSWGDRHHVLLLVLHHLVGDGWSMGVLIREMLALYPAFCEGTTRELPPLAIQYGDFALWEGQSVPYERQQINLAFWQTLLQDAPVQLTLPTDYPRPVQATFRGQTHHQVFPLELSEALKRSSQSAGVTLFMLLLGAYSILLQRYSGQTDLLIGSTFAKRQWPETQPLIGLLLNTLLFRIDTSGNPTGEELLERVKQVALDAFAHPEIPFEELARTLTGQDRRTEWFQTMFILQSTPQPKLSLPDVELSLLSVHGNSAKCDLSLWMIETPDGLRAEWEYNCNLFEAATLERMAEQYQQILGAMVQSLDQPLTQLMQLSASEGTRLAQRTQTPPHCQSVLQPVFKEFEDQVQQTPQAIALEHDSTRWTYLTLNETANRIAHTLRSQGVSTEDLVGVCLPRSLELIATLLGILKAGATYIPLDPTYPRERLHHMLEDAQVTALVTSQDLQHTLQLDAPIIVDIGDSAITQQPTSNPNVTVSLAQSAYIIYTSGSTGKPKGTLLNHKGLANFVREAIAQYGFCQQDRVLQFASISFDAAVEEIYCTLCSGGTLVLRSDDMLSSSLTFCQSIAAQGLTVLDLPTAFWHRLTQDLAQGIATLPDSLRLVIIGGERVLPQTIQLWQQITQHQPIRLLNTYGPTEATVVATSYELTPQTQILPGMDVPIGKPLGNVQVYVLDADQQQVPLGVPGELYLGGDGLADGYLNRPELTNACFIPHPFQPTGKLYKTGDRVRMLATGDLVYLGRMDDQVKVRGFRVELGEIERTLQSHPAVRESAVIAQTDAQNIVQLIAYVVPEGTQLDTNDLRFFLKTQLPDYMVPALMMSVASIPLTPTGKLDRRSLPQPKATDWTASDSYVAPRTSVEAALTFMVAEVLGLERIGIYDNFFTLGGHSLSAMQVLTRIRTMFGKDVTLRSLFSDPTIAALATQLEQTSVPDQRPETEAITIVDRSQPLALSFAQERLWFLYQFEGISATYNLPFALRLRGQINLAAMEQSLNAIVERHESLRTTFAQRTEQSIQIVHPAVALHIPVVDGEGCDERWIQEQIHQESRRCFDLEAGPLLRLTLLRLSADEHVLLVTMHHIISDAWSIGVFVQEIMAHYPSFCNAQTPKLASLPIQYADYAAWQRQQQQNADFQQRLETWVQQFVDAPPLLELPTDRPRPAVQTFQGGLIRTELPRDLTQALKRFSQQHQKTLFMTLIGAFVTLLHRYSRQDDLVVGTPIAGRTHPDLERLIGFFINTLPLRFKIDSDAAFTTFLDQVQTQTLDAFANQDIPFGQLIERLPLTRDLSYLPLCQTLFVLQNAPSETLQLPDLTLEPIPTHSGVSRFDLTLSISEVGDRLIAEWEYNSDLFDPSTIERMAAQFEVLLTSLTTNPQQSIATLPLLSAAERQMLLVEWNQTHRDLPIRCIHHWIEDQVLKTPSAIALEFDDAQLTYQELNTQANQLAHYLQSLGVRPNSLVGICLPQSPERIICMLAVWKAGGAYIPLDPTYPQTRLDYMLRDAQIPFLILQTGLETRFTTLDDSVQCLKLDAIAPQFLQLPSDNPQAKTTPTDLAYVIYTSGSTGQPKGVMIEHKGLGNLAFAQIEAFQVTPQSRVLQMASFSFDASVSKILMALCSGARLCLGSVEALVETQMAPLIQRNAITHITMPPS
ncbi:MAG TPA: amino acid adenylation domain-containing protein, partial [Stenomitos sp.]